MARIRTIKPEFPQSESVGRLSRDARLLFIQLWTVCDDSGRTRAHSRVLASLLYPFDDDAAKLIDGWLGELEAGGFISRYVVEGTSYLYIPKWLAHQKIDRPSKSHLPDPRETDANTREPSRSLDAHTLDLVPSTKDLGPTREEEKKLDEENAGARGEPSCLIDPSSLKPAMRYVKGGAQQFAGIGPQERPKKNPAKADQHLVDHMTTTGHLPADQAWMLVMAARDPDNPEHIDAARQCEKYSRAHKLGWFHEEAA